MIEEWAALIPADLIESFQIDPPVVFIGAGFGKEAIPPLKTAAELTKELRDELGVSADSGEGLSELLQYLKNQSAGSKRSVVEWLRKKLLHDSNDPGGAHYLLLHLSSQEFITTNYDSLLVKAARKIQGYTLTPVDDPGSYQSTLDRIKGRNREAVLGRIHGAYESEDRLVATTDDYIHNYTQQKKWPQILEERLRNRRVIFIGYSLRDFTTWTSYISMLVEWGNNKYPHVMVAPTQSTHVTTFWSNYGIQYIPLKAHQFLIGLHDRLNNLENVETVAFSAAASCLNKSYDDTVTEIEQVQKDSSYSSPLRAALTLVEEIR